MSNYRKDLTALAKKSGRKVEHTRGNHLRLVAEGKQPVIAPLSPGRTYRTLLNARALLRRLAKEEVRS
jgi:hypothetical protein